MKRVIWFFQYVGGNVVTKKLHLMWTRKTDFPSSLFYTCSLWQDFVGLVELWFLEVIILSDSCPVKFCKRLCRESLLWSSFPVCLPLSLFLSVSLCVSSSLLGTFQIFCLAFLLFSPLLCYYFYLFLLFPSSIPLSKQKKISLDILIAYFVVIMIKLMIRILLLYTFYLGFFD